MEKAKISAIQLFALMFMFEMGTALVILYGIAAKNLFLITNCIFCITAISENDLFMWTRILSGSLSWRVFFV